MKMYQGPRSLDNQGRHESGSSTDIPPPIYTEYSPYNRSTNTEYATPLECLSDESDCSSTRAWYGDAPEDRSRGYGSPSDYTPRTPLTADIIRDHFSSGRVTYYSQQGNLVPRQLHEQPHDTLAQVGARSTSRYRHHAARASPPSPRIRSQVFFQISGVMAAHGRMSSEHMGLHMAAETGRQLLETNEPARTRIRKSVHFNPLTMKYGGASGPEYGSLSPPAPGIPYGVPMKHMLDKHGDLLQCYQ